MKRNKRAEQLKRLQEQKASGQDLSQRQQTRLNYLSRRSQDVAPRGAAPAPMPAPVDTGFGQQVSPAAMEQIAPQGEPQGERPAPQFQPDFGPGPNPGLYGGFAHSGMLPQQPQSHPGFLKPQFAADAAAAPRQFQPLMQGTANPSRKHFAQNWGSGLVGLGAMANG